MTRHFRDRLLLAIDLWVLAVCTALLARAHSIGIWTAIIMVNMAVACWYLAAPRKLSITWRS